MFFYKIGNVNPIKGNITGHGDVAFGNDSLIHEVTHPIQHILDEDAVPRGGIIDQYVGHSADQLAVLNNGAAAHPLDNASRFLQQGRIGDGNGEAFVACGPRVNIRYGYLIALNGIAVQCAIQIGRPLPQLTLPTDGDGLAGRALR